MASNPNQPSLFPDTEPRQPEPIDLAAYATEIARVADTPERRALVTDAYERDAAREGFGQFDELQATRNVEKIEPEDNNTIGGVAIEGAIKKGLPAEYLEIRNKLPKTEPPSAARRRAELTRGFVERLPDSKQSRRS